VGTEPLALRDRALLEVMYACGLRASEAIGLQASDVDLDEGMLRARGKGSKERLVPIGRQAVAALRAYEQRGRPALVGHRVQTQLFVNHRGGALTRQGLYKIVQGPRPRRRPGAEDEPAHAPPQLRHPPARRRLRPALPAGDAWSRRPRDHQVYTHLSADRLKDVYFRAHPRAKR